MTASVCPVRCRLHTKFLHHEPCVYCRPSHATVTQLPVEARSQRADPLPALASRQGAGRRT